MTDLSDDLLGYNRDSMQKINWQKFKSKFEGVEQDTFEWLCYLLFCREFNRPSGIPRYINHGGIETVPIQTEKGYIGFQSKFTDKPSSLEKELKNNITTAKNQNKDLSIFRIYLHKDFGTKGKGEAPKYKTHIEEHARSLGVEVEWKLHNYFESPEVTAGNADLIKFFFSDGPNLIETAETMHSRTKLLLEAINEEIDFHDKKIKLDRSEILSSIMNEDGSLPLVINGRAGVGKTALVKSLYNSLPQDDFLIMLKSTQLRSLNDIDEVTGAARIGFTSFLRSFNEVENKYLVIDSAESLIGIETPELVGAIIQESIKNGWKLIFTIRSAFLEELITLLDAFGQTHASSIIVDRYHESQLINVANDYGFSLPTSSSVKELIRTPFYLREYLKNYNDESQATTYSSFKDSLWNNKIAGNNKVGGVSIARETLFQKLAWERAVSDGYYIEVSDDTPAIVQELLNDEILIKDKSTGNYAISHDMYEEWALVRKIENKWVNKKSFEEFYNADTLPLAASIRKAYRIWLIDKIARSVEDDWKVLLTEILLNTDIPQRWRDETSITILQQDDPAAILNILDDNLIANNFELLVRFIFLLRTACKTANESFLKALKLSSEERVSLELLYNVPSGGGWEYLINFIWTNIETIQLSQMTQILPLLNDWVQNNKSGETTRSAGKIALFYYETLFAQDSMGYRDEPGKSIRSIILNSAEELKPELTQIIDEVVSKSLLNHRDKYHDLCDDILGDLTKSYHVAHSIPNKVISLATISWLKTKSEQEDDYYTPMHDIEGYFNLSVSTQDYSPSSSLQTPFLAILQVEPRAGMDFIVWLINIASSAYAASDLGTNEVEEVDLIFNDGSIRKQILSARLWEMYRGGMHVSTELLSSLLMALEKSLLQIGKVCDRKQLDDICMHMLSSSSSAAIASLISAIVCAYPEKTFNTALVLFRTKRFFLYDTTRWTKESSHKQSLVMLKKMYPGGANELFENEKIQSCDDKHREINLEHLMFKYQLVGFEGDSDTDFVDRKTRIWEILDKYYEELPPKEDQTDGDHTWRMYLARIDVRKMTPIKESVNGETYISFKPEIDPDLQQKSDSVQQETQDVFKHSKLSVWSQRQWNRESVEDLEQNQKYQDPSIVIEEVRQIIQEAATLPDDRKMFDAETPFYAYAVLLRDYNKKLKKKEASEIGTYLTSCLMQILNEENRSDFYQGSIPAIVSILPLIMNISDEFHETAKTLLFAFLFDKTSVSQSESLADFAAMAVRERLWESNFEDAQSLLSGYIELCPKFRGYKDEKHKEYYAKKNSSEPPSSYKILLDFLDQNESVVESAINSKLTSLKIPNIEDTDSSDLKAIFLILPLSINDDSHKQLATQILKYLAPVVFKRHEARSYMKDIRFFEKLSHMLLRANNDDINAWMEIIIPQLTVEDGSANFIEQLVKVDDRFPYIDSFWRIWKIMYSKVIELSVDQNTYRHNKSFLLNYLLTSNWKDEAVEWHSLPINQARWLFGGISKDLSGNTVVLHSIAKILSSVASNYLLDGAPWLYKAIEKHDGTKTKLETNTIYYLERILQKYVLQYRMKIKKDLIRKGQLVAVLDFMIENGSSSAYKIREEIF